MLTLATKTAIAVLVDINGEVGSICTEHLYANYPHLPELLSQLECGGLIRLLPDHERSLVSSYELSRPVTEISLLDILVATGEHVNCNQPLAETYYFRYGVTANKLGTLNSIMRNFLSNIHLNDL